MFTDPVVVTGLVSNEELAVRSSVGFFLFGPPGVNEQLIADAGLELVKRDDVTENTAAIAGRWHAARADDEEALVKVEGEEGCGTFSRPCISSRASAACRESHISSATRLRPETVNTQDLIYGRKKRDSIVRTPKSRPHEGTPCRFADAFEDHESYQSAIPSDEYLNGFARAREDFIPLVAVEDDKRGRRIGRVCFASSSGARSISTT